MKRAKVRNAIKMVVFLVIVVMILNVLSAVFIPKQKESTVKYNGEVTHIDLFYKEPHNTLDVIFLGSSHIYSGISPMEMWNAYGIVGYDVTSSSQCAYKSYHFLKDIFQCQRPKIIVFDLMSLFIGESVDEISNRSALNYMRFSPNFLTTAYHSLNRENGETLESYIFPILRYHSRWEELLPVDFNIKKQRNCAKGYDMRYGTKCMVKLTKDQFPFLTEPLTDEVAGIVENSAGYIRDMVELCEENGTEIVFIKTPVSGYTHEIGNAMQKFADECGVKLIDYNRKWDELGLDYTVDFLDTVHLNLNGAKKLTKCLGKTLVDEFNLPDHRGEEAYSGWDEDYKIYQAQLAALELQYCDESSEYLELIQNKDYVMMYSGNIEKIEDGVRGRLGLLPAEQGTVQYGVLDIGDKERSAHNAGNGKMRYDIADVKCGTGDVKCGTGDVGCEISAEGSYKIRLLGEDIVQGEDGFYLTVFDKRLGIVVDAMKISDGQIVREQG